MKVNLIKKLLGISLFVLFISNIFIGKSTALEVETHSAINKYIADENSTVYGSYLNDYLKNNLGIKDGVKATFNSKMLKEWIADGGEYEDNFLRYLNHFYNPLSNSGLLGNIPAKNWAIRPIGNQYADGQYSWFDARDYYLKALTSSDKATRENNFAETFRAIGQMMHLVQDMSVPAHTRDDAHPTIPPFAKGDPYEKWAQQNAQISAYNAYNYTPYNSSFLIPQLFDTGQYNNGGNPAVTTLSSSIGLAEYTNANFLSAGTIFKNFDYPSYKPGISMAENEITINNKQVLYLKKIGEGETINYFARAGRFYKKLPAEYKPLELTVKDNKVHENYAQLLIPRAISYSSQVLSYFFRGQLEVEMGEGSLKIKNASNETMTGGKFELYYDNANGERNLVTINAGADVSELKPGGDPQTITFSPQQNAESYMLVYRDGKLGDETNAVIGKFIPTELVVITVNMESKSVSFVWNPASNSLARTPIDNAAADFQEWLTKREDVGEDLFSNEMTCGRGMAGSELYGGTMPIDPAGTYPSGCSQLTPGMMDTIVNQWTYDVQATYAIGYLIPTSVFSTVLLPGSPSPTTGFRTHLISNADGITYSYYGPLGEMGSFKMQISENISNEGSNEGSRWWDSHGSEIFIPGWRNSAYFYGLKGYPPPEITDHIWYNHSPLVGKYTLKTIANICVLQFTPMTHTWYATAWAYPDGGPVVEIFLHSFEYTPGTARTIMVQAQALYVREGTTGYDWVTAGRNAALETQIIAAINMAYSLNGIPDNEIRGTSISIEIVR